MRPPGVRARSGNAMQRTRSALLTAAEQCVEGKGARRTTMTDVAAHAGVAKATLYNHFRTKDDLLAGLLQARVAELGAACAVVAEREGLARALAAAAVHLGGSGALRGVAADDPALLAPLAVPGEGRGWDQARAGVHAVLTAGHAAAGPVEQDLVLRWLLSQLLWPVAPVDAEEQAGLLAAALPAREPIPAPVPASALPAQGRSSEQPRAAGLGWPG